MDTLGKKMETPMLDNSGKFTHPSRNEITLEFLPLSKGAYDKLYGRGSSHKISIFICKRCSAVVSDKQNHAQFHVNVEDSISIKSVIERAN